jgi:5-methylcytosine-specific restriction endonuclease McrA
MKLKTLKPRVATLGERIPVLAGNSWRADKHGANARLYTYRWQKASKAFLREHPLCQCPDCDEGRLRVTPSNVVDHHVPHRGDPVLFWDRSNWRAMAKACHDRKTQREATQTSGGAL